MTKKKSTFVLDSEIIKDLKIKAIQLDTTTGKLLERYIKEGLKKDK
ncbi:MAG: hypothetical protein FWE58_03045 [Methanobrevibacter sp.]|nr:hypothetical protein [Methanobrevibacter sp.]